ncbi:hypothetical protein ABT075_43890 [Streptomyces sp. NPDC002677]|uniref:hypothetical protein n=1 Tax=Streptomyces sp. NPDC002677 TaxID=3154774 RepID=UPI00332F5AF3
MLLPGNECALSAAAGGRRTWPQLGQFRAFAAGQAVTLAGIDLGLPNQSSTASP